jgi:MtN3 and saliva related transmembrane protein
LETIGYIAATLTTISFLPQAYKVYKTKDTSSISLGMFSLLNVGLFLWLIYGISKNIPPVIISNAITLVVAMYIWFVKLKEVLDKKANS